MTKKNLTDLKNLYYAKLLYKRFYEAYIVEGSRGYREDLRNAVEGSYNRFNKVNERLPEEDRIKPAVTLKLSA